MSPALIQALLGLVGPIIFFAVIAIWFFSAAVKVVQEYERGVVFRLGRLAGARGPGLILLIPRIERMVKVDLRVITLDVPAQEAITRDNVTVRVNAVVYFRVLNPADAVVKVLDYIRATSLDELSLRVLTDFADGAEAFAEAVVTAARDDSPEERRRRVERARPFSWERRIDEMEAAIEEAARG